MPSWSSRLLATSHPAGPGSSATGNSPHALTGSQSSNDPPTHLNSSPSLRPPAHETDASSNSSPSKFGARHGRSLSHPFPYIFSGKKKVQPHETGEDPANGHVSTTSNMGSSSSPSKAGLGGASKQGRLPDNELIQGKCMTCDSTVRWPKDLKVYRCTICLMINDLKPIDPPPQRFQAQRDASPARPGKTPSSAATRQAPPVSIERTQAIIDRCITGYLQHRMKAHAARQKLDLLSAPDSSIFSDALDLSDEESHRPLSFSRLKPASTLAPPIYLSSPPVKLGGDGTDIPDPDGRPHTSYSTSLPGHLSSPLEQMDRNGVESIVPKPPIRQPPPPPSNGTTGNGDDVGTREPIAVDRPGQSSKRRENIPNADEINKQRHDKVVSIFRPLEDYIVDSFSSWECLNSSFSTRPRLPIRAASEGTETVFDLHRERGKPLEKDIPISDLDEKTLLLGDFAENGSWWTGGRTGRRRSHGRKERDKSVDTSSSSKGLVSMRSPRIDWVELNEWYHIFLSAGKSWRTKFQELYRASEFGKRNAGNKSSEMTERMREIEEEIDEARLHMHRTLLKATENLLKRPGHPIRNAEDARVLLILLTNPLFYSSSSKYISSVKANSSHARDRHPSRGINTLERRPSRASPPLQKSPGKAIRGLGQHSSIIKRIIGLLSNLPNDCHRYLVSWFSRFSESHFQRTVELIGSFVTYRLSRQNGRKRGNSHDPTAGLIPNLSGPGAGSSAQLHAALGLSGAPKTSDGKPKPVVYAEDWQIKAASKIMSLLFAANNSGTARKTDPVNVSASDAGLPSAGLVARDRAQRHGQIIPTSDFYNTLLDYSDLIADFEAWESRRGKFSFCQYPFFLSIWAKIKIMEYDARRQMDVKAREAFFNSIMSRKSVSQFLVLKVRRDCLVEDSLRSVSEVVGTGQEEIKKGLRIEFMGEEGVDAGGLRKEWFLLLVREVFDPNHGMFVYDEDSHFCYFNPYCFETSDQFFLVGVVLGLAIYNSTILDVALPPFAFKKLLASAPQHSTTPRPPLVYTLDDLAEFRPALANGLRQLLEFDGDVQETFCRDFVADVDRYGQNVTVPLRPDGENRPVTNANRREFVDLYVQYLLDTAVARQFEPLKRGFYTVCGGNALALFRPEEIELLVRGSDEPLDVSSLRAVATYENWLPNDRTHSHLPNPAANIPLGSSMPVPAPPPSHSPSPSQPPSANPSETEKPLIWFWDIFARATPMQQRKLLSFITGSDRIPAMGATNLVIKVSCLGPDCERFPIARTCFNQLGLWRYASREKLEMKLWRAVDESEGFGLK
ncbi:MAG: hypothetical protein M1819_007418 [Sarea resinae]|nr:MAG: hypothetical protein M1819_007418 [Sarea resinae]